MCRLVALVITRDDIKSDNLKEKYAEEYNNFDVEHAEYKL